MILLKNIIKSYGSKKNKNIILNDISFKAEDGEMIAFMGKSGSGKTTLLNIIGVLDEIDDGSYLLDDTRIEETPPGQMSKIRKSNFGFVVQDFALIEEKDVFYNVSLPLKYSKVNKKEMKTRVAEALKDMQIEGFEDRIVKDLSGGEKQRVSIARAIINSPKIILADEPTGSLDEATEKDILEVFKKLNKEKGITIILATHSKEVAVTCDKVYKVQNGKIGLIYKKKE